MKRLLLVGAGHAHALVLKAMAARPLEGVEVRLVSPSPLAPYSGMVPGWLAGHYRFDEIAIDVPPLARAAGVHWMAGEIASLDPDRRCVTLESGDVLPYDLLSLNVGSTLCPPRTRRAEVLPLRPLGLLHDRVVALLERWQGDPGRQPWVVTAVGGGAAGFEALLALLHRLRSLRPDREVHGSLVTRGPTLLTGVSPAARRRALRALDRAGIVVQLGSGWCDAVDHSSDVVLWATGAQAHPWQRDASRRGALAVDAQGFVRIGADLRSTSHPQVFAVGDCASWSPVSLPKAGVHAVRMGPTLFNNLQAALFGRPPLRLHRPQQQFLALLATGERRAIASRGAFGTEGAWVWRWKDRIDRRFLAQFEQAALPTPRPAAPLNPPARSVAVNPGDQP